MGDVNDNPPVCLRAPMVELNKDAPVGTVVATILVTDADEGVNSQIIFQDIRGQYSPQYLGVDTDSGVIRTMT